MSGEEGGWRGGPWLVWLGGGEWEKGSSIGVGCGWVRDWCWSKVYLGNVAMDRNK